MDLWPEPQCSDKVLVSSTQEFVKEMQDAMGKMNLWPEPECFDKVLVSPTQELVKEPEVGMGKMELRPEPECYDKVLVSQALEFSKQMRDAKRKMKPWPEPECSLEVLASSTEEFVKELEDAMDRVKRELSSDPDMKYIFKFLKSLKPKPPIPDAKPDSDEVLDDDDYDETLNDDDYDETLNDDGYDETLDDDDYDGEYDDDDGMLCDDDAEGDQVYAFFGVDRAELARLLDAAVTKKPCHEWVLINEENEVQKKLKVALLKRDEAFKEIRIFQKVADFFMGPLYNDRYCVWFDIIEDIAPKIIRYHIESRKAFDSYHMKLYGCVMPLPFPDFDYMAIVKQYILKFQQHHLSLQVPNCGPDGKQGGKQVQAPEQLHK